MNLAMLIGGYGAGQGSIFLAQTWLVTQGELELLALFGTHFAFAMFGIIVVEAGSLTILARHAASMEHGEESAAVMWRTFWEMSVFRGFAAIIVIAGAIIFDLTMAASPFSRGYLLFAAPAFLFWALNAAGFLDGLRLSGISGISGSIAYAASALALIVVEDFPPDSAGMVLGGAFTAGYFLTVVVQFVALRLVGWRVRFEKPTRKGIFAAGYGGLALLGGTLPGQLYYRAQLLMCSAWLGPGATALFIYVKQVVTAVVQLTGFIRRVEFPALVQRLTKDTQSPIATIWKVQRKGTYVALAAAVCAFVAGIVLLYNPSEHFSLLGKYLLAYAASIALAGVSRAYEQGLAATGKFGALFVRSFICTMIGLGTSFALARVIGVYAFALGDTLVVLFSIGTILFVLRNQKPTSVR
ncbi:MAG TPA: hypothetical protein VEZ26_05565 [Sphingomonadaceae bacterium]|nr:hypothetical protein [Sphingomonadaceae bacterium]